MGQCYSVEADFSFKNGDPSSFCKAVKDYVKENDGKNMIFRPYEDSAFDTPFGCFGVICPNSYEENGHMSADFDASYGWESVLNDVFKLALAECDEGSSVDVYPDSEPWSLKVKNGKVMEISVC